MSVRLRGRCVRPPRRKHSVPDARPSEGGEGKKLGDPRRDPGHAVGGPEDVQEDRRPRRDEHIRGGGVLMIRFAAVILAVLLLASGSRGEEGEPPRIFLEKKIFEETSTGRKNFYAGHTVSKGESLGTRLRGECPLFPADSPSMLREFRRANPNVKDPGRLAPGQKILVPAGIGMKTARLMRT